MPTYTVEVNGESFDIDAPNDEAVRAAVRQLQGQQPAAPAPAQAPVEQPDARDNFAGKVDTVVRGAADTLTLGLSDELTAQIRSNPLAVQKKPEGYYDKGIYAGDYNPLGVIARAMDAPFASDTKAADYEKALAEERAIDKGDAENRFGYRLGGQVVGGVTGGIGLAKNGLSLAAKAAERGAGLARVSGASLLDGSILGGAQGFGSGEGVEDRLYKAGLGMLTGGALGAIAPGAVAGGSKLLKTAVAPFVAPFMPGSYTRDMLATALRRAGQTPEEVANSMRAAADDGQDMFNVADALGYTGERLTSTATRVPHEGRQALAEVLMTRQAGQGERLANNLAEGFDTFDTAGRRVADRTAQRTAEANELYPAARADAGPVNVTPILEEIDQTLRPGVNQLVNPRDRIANDSIEGALTRVRAMMSDGNSQVTDFDTLFRTKLDLDDMIQRAEGQGAGNRAHYLSRVKDLVDQALADASDQYTGARDAFARASRRIDAVDAGRDATRISRRAQDTIPEFEAMPTGEQVDFRAGYVDPLIARLEGASSSPTTNKARMLQTPKYEAELPAFAAPGRGPQLADRIGREQTMFRTANAALGNSKTADNLADAADLNQFDPQVIGRLVRGDPIGALTTGLAKLLGTATGQPPSVVHRLSQVLMETNPDVALEVLRGGADKLSQSDQLRARLVSALVSSGAAGAGRLAAP
ncbi:hypothetical protein HFN78_35160 [Rhizobium laguerreae]|uniref:hypothetical protein n=1 Tax=Rhizobium laguerreae TaxID=1076926 RepID=UPI001C9037D1|nr:hypothetical protein [Rhizobium laguerreae]MBY3476073.1 hypothetical protein [Rhizobium laguerreae]MBY3521089.1 hypothetical protein [Rhizobium laguerreae]